jgi:poly(A) polymerase
LDIHAEVEKIVSPVYLVGGSVRDELLGIEPHDHDFATPLLPDQIEACVRAAGRKPYCTGKRFGTIGFGIPQGSRKALQVEVTTFRSESYKSGSRKPEVQFVSNIAHDLSRRDFTVNAIARRGKRIIDPEGGRDDLSHGILRAVGIPSHRFREDPLRMLRLARFAAQFGFSVDDRTFSKARELSYKVLTVSRERWMQELDKLLVSDHVTTGLELLADTRLLNYVLPEIAIQVGYDQQSPYHDFTLWEHTCKVVTAAPAEPTIRWAALLHDIGKPAVRKQKTDDHCTYVRHDLIGHEMVRKLASYLKWSNDRTDAVSALVRDHLSDASPLREYDSGAQKRN